MTNFIYRINVDLNDNATVRQQVCVAADNREEADLRARIAAFYWWGYPEREDEGNWVVSCENYDAWVPCEPDFIGIASNGELEVLKKFEYYFDVLTPMPVEGIIPDLQEAIEFGLDLENTKDAIIKHFGMEIYARLALEKEET